MSFSSLGLDQQLLATVTKLGYSTPSPIQQAAIPAVLSGEDVMAAGQTGTGKTASFCLPTLQTLAKGKRAKHNQVRALVLTPTRELALQVAESAETYRGELDLTTSVVYGGVKINPQMQKLRGGIDLLIATPGRLLDLYQQNAIKFDQLEVFILDEADRMLDMGFIRDIKKIEALLPKQRQNLMFSATFSDEIKNLAMGILRKPKEIIVSAPNKTVDTVTQAIIPVLRSERTSALSELIHKHQLQQVLVFIKTKHGANALARKLTARGISAAPIHGNRSQNQRVKALDDFKSGDVRVLVATDIVARGLDIELLPNVVNFDLPKVPEDYVHRIGRTGRAGAKGEAISFVDHEDFKLLQQIEKLTQQLIPREELDGFSLDRPLPESSLEPIKHKKPKKKKAPASHTARPERNQSRSRSNNSDTSNKPKTSRFSSEAKNSNGRNKPGQKKTDSQPEGAKKASANNGAVRTKLTRNKSTSSDSTSTDNKPRRAPRRRS